MELYKEIKREDVVKRLGEQGFVSVSDDMNMENYQKTEEFYSAYISGEIGRASCRERVSSPV